MKKILLVVCVVMVAVMLATMFVGCSAEDYAKKLEKKDYKVTTVTNEDALDLLEVRYGAEDDLKFVVTGIKEGSVVEYVKFEKTADAKNYANSLKDADGVKVSRSGSLVKTEATKK